MRGRLAVAGYLATLTVLGGCAGGDDGGRAARSDGPKPLAGAPLFGGQLEAAERYRTRAFQPALSFVVHDGNWTAESTESRTLLILWGDLGRPATPPRPVNVAFQRYPRIYEPDRPGDGPQSTVPAPRNLVGWLRRHPDLSVGRTSSTRIGGLEGRQLDATLTTGKPRHSSPECTIDCVALAPNAWFPKGSKVRFIALESDGPPLVATVAAPPRDFERFSGRAQRVLNSVRFAESQ